MQNTKTDEKPEIVIVRRSSRMRNGRYIPAYYRVYQNRDIKGEFSTRKAAENLVNRLQS